MGHGTKSGVSPPGVGRRYRKWRGTSACHCADSVSGGASSSRRAEPQFDTAQMGASRSVSPDRERIERRLLEARKLGADNWYLSGKRNDGRARYV